MAYLISSFSWLNAFEELHGYIVKDAAPSDRVGIVLRNPNFPDKPIGLSFRRVDQLSVKVIMALLDKVMQSNASFFSSDLLVLNVDRVTIPVGYGRKNLTGLKFEDFCRAKRQGIIVVPASNDNNCLARALILAIAFRNNDPMRSSMETGCPLLQRRAMQLCQSGSVDLSQGGSYQHIQSFQNHLASYTIVVYNSRVGDSVYFEGPREQGRVVLNLLLEDEHYNVITSLTSAFTCGYYCEQCRKRYNDKKDHMQCQYQCPCCHEKPPCSIQNAKIVCNDCKRDFHGQECFQNHKDTDLCKKLRRCLKCLKTVEVKGKHRCGYSYCAACRSQKPIGHLCYMAVNKVPRDTDGGKSSMFIFYDLECMQEKMCEGTNDRFLHESNLCVAVNVCPVCIKCTDELNEPCPTCGERVHIFREDPVESFLSYVAEKARKFKVTCIAHNMKGYDGCFVLRCMLANSARWRPKIISNGLKLISIQCDDIRFIDSLSFIPSSLSAFPKTFNFPESKGYFPFLFNTSENRNYEGPLPALEYFCTDQMSAKERQNLLDWHATQNNSVFKMSEEIVKYCLMDVKILVKGCLQFRSMFMSQNKVDPFEESTTIASACNKVFRRLFLKENTIGLIPKGGYRRADKQSKVAIQWLRWVEHSQQLTIQHAGKAREFKTPSGIKVDGYCAETNTVYEFLGCYWHGCEECFPNQANVDPKLDMNTAMFVRNENTVARSQRLRDHGYNLVEMRECDFKRLILASEELRDFIHNLGDQDDEPLNPRDAFYGGRTNASTLYHKCDGISEKIMYYDVCSLYPYVNKYCKYPIGHPKIHVGLECKNISLDTVEGLVKCRVLPPSDLYHPVLPLKMHGKLMFLLCRTCGVELNEGECQHSETERSFVGTFVADELRKAIANNYKVLDVFEIWEYEVTVYDKTTKQGGLFSEYIDSFLKLKQECSGWPSHCTTEDEKKRYIDNYYEKEGILLDEKNIKKNPGLRYLAKLMLNSFWGKFGQRENLPQTSIVSEPKDLFKLLTDPLVQVQAINPINDDVVIVSWNRPEGEGGSLNTINVSIAAYTTAHARLELYSYLEKLGRRVLYYDTDSVIFVAKPDDWNPSCGDFLGQMTDELEAYGEGSYIEEFVSAGPKNYSYNVFSTSDNALKSTCKVKGITLNYKNSRIINFASMKDMVLSNSKDSLYVYNDRKIVRDKSFNVISRPESKQYRISYSKRRRIENFDTLPFGFK
ncbi:hypothetical protein RI129_001317 [Pyrocoelia pectoralis]|uniref:DNA-directed DNA polymerase n=1 Tax=Pyrocoelia pectoralis TaxID=417401 RepID=A0AAN7ZWZ6_9COLE